MPSSTTEPTFLPPVGGEVVKTAEIGLPTSYDSVLLFLRYLLTLSKLQRIEINRETIRVERRVANELAPVIPDELPNTLTAEDVMERLELELQPAHPHPSLSFVAATQRLQELGLRTVGVLAPPGEFLGAFQGLPAGKPATTCYGWPVLVSSDPVMDNKLVVVGGQSSYFYDAQVGIVIDPFLETV